MIFGLGNPGKKYEKNRHNAGFRVVDKLAEKGKCSFKKRLEFNAAIAVFNEAVSQEEVYLVKPQTFMNNSGLAAAKIINRFDVAFSDILVVYDDVDLPLGSLRLKQKGSSGGQKGMASIINVLGTQEIQRLRIGIDRASLDTAEYVLSDFTKAEEEILTDVLGQAVSACLTWIESGSRKINVK